jgi:glucan phosphoethanolaminetransferase (alkaline phosphatase superfamily)
MTQQERDAWARERATAVIVLGVLVALVIFGHLAKGTLVSKTLFSAIAIVGLIIGILIPPFGLVYGIVYGIIGKRIRFPDGSYAEGREAVELGIVYVLIGVLGLSLMVYTAVVLLMG